MNDLPANVSAQLKALNSEANTAQPPTTLPYENDIRRFVDAMRYKLMKNAHKGRWENIDLANTLEFLQREVQELVDAIESGNTVEILLEAADVANFAMIAASIAIEKGK